MIFSGSLFGAIVTRAEMYFRLVYISFATIHKFHHYVFFNPQDYDPQKSKSAFEQVGEIFAEQFEQQSSQASRLWLKLG